MRICFVLSDVSPDCTELRRGLRRWSELPRLGVADSVGRAVCGRLSLVVWGLVAALLLSPNAHASRGSVPVRPRAAAQLDETLTAVKQVRELRVSEAARLIPVRLTGVVTAFSGWKNSFFFQDGTAGISVDRSDAADVRMGDRVTITGTTGGGLFAPLVLASRVVVLGQGSPPVAPQVFYDDLFGGAQDSQWVRMEGIVHAGRITTIDGHLVLVLNLEIGGGTVKVLIHDYVGIDFAHLVDAKVRLQGVCATDFNQKRQFIGSELYVPAQKYIEVLEAANPDPFSMVATPVRNALQFGQAQHRVKVTGVSTYQVAGHALYLQDGEDGIRIQSGSTQWIGPGRNVEAVGFPVMGEYAPILQDGYFRDLGPAVPIVPVPIEARDVVVQREGFDHVPYDQQLVQLRGTVAESHILGGQRSWILRQGSEVFEASLPLSAVSEDVQGIAIGSVLLLTGICTVHADSDHVPISFGILLRSAQDLKVLQRASWWTTEHTLLVLGGVAGVMSLVILWVVVLRKRVEEQTRIIRKSEERFRNLAEHDVLTGLPNRLLLEARITECLAQCRERNLQAALLTIDIDRFKHINDTYGHLVGDECLKAVGMRLRSTVRKQDTVARTGGEEFTLVVGGFPNEERARRIAMEILDLFLDPVVMPGLEIKLTVSVGGAMYPADGGDSETLRRRSDQALYEAKRTGRNRVVFATEALCASIEMETAIESAVRAALAGGKFLLHYQPIYDASGAICRFEALLRTTDAMLNRMGPARFIPVAEASGLIVSLGRWVVGEACRQIEEWQRTGEFLLPVAVNVSVQQLTLPSFAGEVLGVLKQFQIGPEMLEVELTETAAMTELAAVAQTVMQMSAAGVTFAIDDFGTGYSSLSRLHELRIKALKIDRSFVMTLEKGGSFPTILQAVVQMAHSLHLMVVAEGVETEAQFSILRELGCDYFQGFLFSRPLPASAVLEALRRNRARELTEASRAS